MAADLSMKYLKKFDFSFYIKNGATIGPPFGGVCRILIQKWPLQGRTWRNPFQARSIPSVIPRVIDTHNRQIMSGEFGINQIQMDMLNSSATAPEGSHRGCSTSGLRQFGRHASCPPRMASTKGAQSAGGAANRCSNYRVEGLGPPHTPQGERNGTPARPSDAESLVTDSSAGSLPSPDGKMERPLSHGSEQPRRGAEGRPTRDGRAPGGCGSTGAHTGRTVPCSSAGCREKTMRWPGRTAVEPSRSAR
jgi:hypothetical protein